ncbi:hypothetical protein HQ393_04615 [Chitinibacter bivalviorum]|uniref:Uncharacterized protein n=1 Tax=Chitinibacter bivalviorum TaxID=2739434 RepID=A0A7H9BJ61_9NEIS|nr:hypothetical protein [Chitinibacter bivalviorum]QLG87594.1 hypothetical protein HQ393_04615 [Chitinibacter bivalviorum]
MAIIPGIDDSPNPTGFASSLLSGLGQPLAAGLQALAGGPTSAEQKFSGSNNPIFGADWAVNFSGTQKVNTGPKGSTGASQPDGNGNITGSQGFTGFNSPLIIGVVVLGFVAVIWLKKKR